MSMEGRYSARSQEGGAVMSMEGRYSARSQEGGTVMSMDGRAENCSMHFPHFPLPCGSYVARSQKGSANLVINFIN